MDQVRKVHRGLARDDGVSGAATPALPPRLGELLAEMRVPPASAALDYHAFTIMADRDGRPIVSVDSHWIGFKDEGRRIEIRRASLTTAEYAENWAALGQDCFYVTSPLQALAFMLAGGNALVEHRVAQRIFAAQLEPREVHRHGFVGFANAGDLGPGALNRAPSPKLRMEMLKRDARRCRICGRRPDDDVDIVLHLHHIRPWAEGGVTDPANLITLCHTCHRGLDPHFDPSLFEYVGVEDALDRVTRFDEGVAAYRRLSASGFLTGR